MTSTVNPRDLTTLRELGHKSHRMNRLGRRFVGATLAVLGVAILMIAIAAKLCIIVPSTFLVRRSPP